MLKVLITTVNIVAALLFREHAKRELKANKLNAVVLRLVEQQVTLKEESRKAAKLAVKLQELVA